MATVKIAVSIPKTLNEEAEKLARRIKISRSGVYAMAMEECLRRRQNERLLARWNEAYAGEDDPEENAVMRYIKRTHRRRIGGA